MARRVPVGGEQHKCPIPKEVELAIDGLVVQFVIPIFGVKVRFLVEFRVTRRIQFIFLHEDSGLRKELVPPTVIEMEMRIDDVRDVIGSELELSKLSNDLFPRFGARGK